METHINNLKFSVFKSKFDTPGLLKIGACLPSSISHLAHLPRRLEKGLPLLPWHGRTGSVEHREGSVWGGPGPSNAGVPGRHNKNRHIILIMISTEVLRNNVIVQLLLH